MNALVTESRPQSNDAADAPKCTSIPHNQAMAWRFLAALDPDAKQHTFQFFLDDKSRGGLPYGLRPIVHAALDDVWPSITQYNTTQYGVGVFVTVNETDLVGRKKENIKRVRAVFIDADGPEQVQRARAALKGYPRPHFGVGTGRGMHLYWRVQDVRLEEFETLQRALAQRLGTDPAVCDLPRVMRLPGSLWLKSTPTLVKFLEIGGKYDR